MMTMVVMTMVMMMMTMLMMSVCFCLWLMQRHPVVCSTCARATGNCCRSLL